MAIMEILRHQRPRRRTAERIDRQYMAFIGYREEIEEAQRHGYSWCQIGKAIEAEMRERGTWDETWSVWDVQKVYQALRRNGKEGRVAHGYRSVGIAN